jgi:hypothetical protein
MSNEDASKAQASVAGMDAQSGDTGPPPIPSSDDRAHKVGTVPCEEKQLSVTLQSSTDCGRGIGYTRGSPGSLPQVENIGDVYQCAGSYAD